MRTILISCALCCLAFATDAQAQAAHHDKASGLIKAAVVGTADTEPGQASHDALLNAAAHTAAVLQVASPGVPQHKPDSSPEQHKRRTGPAMLIAALAVMSAIALRRLGATDL